MPIPKSLTNLLDKNKIKYEIIKHKIVFTAHDKAATLKMDPKQIVKTVVVGLDKKNNALALISANKNLDKNKLKSLINKIYKKLGLKTIKKIDFATEKWMKAHIKGAKIGAIPPFGSLYKLPVFIDQSLVKQKKLVVNAGDYNTSIKITLLNLLKLEKETIKGSISMPKK